jgi:hypothetical protein
MLHSVVRLLHAIADARNATRLGTMRATIECASRLDAVPNDLAMAMGACRGKCMNGALEAVERARRTLRTDHLKRLVVIVSADVTFRHQAISTSDGCIEHFVVFIYLTISPQAIRSPALPAGSLFISSAWAWMTELNRDEEFRLDLRSLRWRVKCYREDTMDLEMLNERTG